MTTWNVIANPAKRAIKAITPISHLTDDNAYVEVLDLDLRWLTDTNIIMGVTTNSLDYRVLVKNDYAAGVARETTSGTIVAGDQDSIILSRHARVTVEVKPTVAATHGTINISVIAGRE